MTYTPAYAEPDCINARDYGVTGDGTLQTAAWLAAWGASKNKRLILPSGKILVDAPVVMDPAANYFVEGHGSGTGMMAGTCVTNVGASHGVVCNAAGDVGRDHYRWFKNWRFEGNRYSQDGFHMAQAFAFRMNDMWISGHGKNGIYGYRTYSSIIRDTIVTHNGSHGVYFEEWANNVLLDGVKSFANSRNGGGFGAIVIGASSVEGANMQTTIQNCDWSGGGMSKWDGGVDGGAFGLILQHCYSAKVSGNYAEISPNLLTYIASNCRGVLYEANYMQDGIVLFEEGIRGVDFSNSNVFHKVTLNTQFKAASSAAKSALHNCSFKEPELIGGAVKIIL